MLAQVVEQSTSALRVTGSNLVSSFIVKNFVAAQRQALDQLEIEARICDLLVEMT